MANAAIVADVHVTLPSWEITLQLVVRWIHFVGGITWIGLLYFFNLVHVPLMKSLESEVRVKVFPGLVRRAMLWFRWSALLTVLAGLFYWSFYIIMPDARNGRLHGFEATGKPTLFWFLVIWTVAFAIEMALLMIPVEAFKRALVLGPVVFVILIVAGYVWLSLNSHAWESSRLQAIGIGGGLGWFMLLNVWGVIWRIQKKLIRWTSDNAQNGTPLPAEAPRLIQTAVVVSRVNFAVSFPMLLLMGAASHYPFIAG